jgi:two-component system chemotaxis response regulator CheY
MKFLIIDDSTTMRRILVNSLQRIGYKEAVEAANGQDALGVFDSGIQFVITDWNMPVMSGLEFVKALRGRDDGKTVPILMVTTRGAECDIIGALQAGVTGYILKPFQPAVLKEKIDAILSGMPAVAR